MGFRVSRRRTHGSKVSKRARVEATFGFSFRGAVGDGGLDGSHGELKASAITASTASGVLSIGRERHLGAERTVSKPHQSEDPQRLSEQCVSNLASESILYYS